MRIEKTSEKTILSCVNSLEFTGRYFEGDKLRLYIGNWWYVLCPAIDVVFETEVQAGCATSNHNPRLAYLCTF